VTDTSKEPARIASMFDAIAGRYDLLNHVLSGGLDLYWRRRALQSLRLSGRELLLDVCTGTGDVALAARRRRAFARRVIGVDFANAMLVRGRAKVVGAGLTSSITLVRGDALALPVRSESVDAVTVAFGIRNVADVSAACREMRRALRRGGRIGILEFAVPTGPVFRAVYGAYFRHILPRVGRILSGHSVAYSYLPASVQTFASPEDFVAVLANAGFSAVQPVPLTFGAVYLYTAVAA
jgi:demethylmenaquinone methyltransferase/2-methoxy-6-polyprenyl-1,4-benzoquinol methylase